MSSNLAIPTNKINASQASAQIPQLVDDTATASTPWLALAPIPVEQFFKLAGRMRALLCRNSLLFASRLSRRMENH